MREVQGSSPCASTRMQSIETGILFVTTYGGIAQLVERLNGIQEVAGSTPTISTKRERKRTNLEKVHFHKRFGRFSK